MKKRYIFTIHYLDYACDSADDAVKLLDILSRTRHVVKESWKDDFYRPMMHLHPLVPSEFRLADVLEDDEEPPAAKTDPTAPPVAEPIPF